MLLPLLLNNLMQATGSAPVFFGPVSNITVTVDVAMASVDLSVYFTGATSYSIAGTLPAGVTLNTSTGVLSGTPTETGTFAGLVVTGTNASGSTDSGSFSLICAAAGGRAKFEVPSFYFRT
jgi:hypothetical protein